MESETILFLEPVLKEVVWGGTRLRDEFGYPAMGEHTGECWGISAHPNGDCRISEGKYKGVHLSALYQEHPEWFGNLQSRQYPLLVKIIDAADKLSIQVHPDDAYAREHENGSLGKTECWYILDCPPDAQLVVGHNAKSRQELERMIRENRYEELIRRVPVKKGDFVQIEPGTVHAITEGILLLETQQNSDITYRVYDYDRKPARPLHVAQSIDAIRISKEPENPVVSAADTPDNTLTKLVACPYYTVWKLMVEESFSMQQNQAFLQISVVEGTGCINGHPVKKGTHCVAVFGAGRLDFTGHMQLILSAPA